MSYGYRAEYEGIVYFIEQTSNCEAYSRNRNGLIYNLSVRVLDERENHVTGGVPIYKLKELAEKDLIRKLKIKND